LESPLRKAVQQFLLHHHLERNHQDLGNRLIMPEKLNSDPQAPVECSERLGGMPKYYRGGVNSGSEMDRRLPGPIRHSTRHCAG
jgi:hypothetical protein